MSLKHFTLKTSLITIFDGKISTKTRSAFCPACGGQKFRNARKHGTQLLICCCNCNRNLSVGALIAEILPAA